MKPPFPSLTQEWHNASYPAIDPKAPSNSHKGQTVIVTGGGSGIGQATAIAFAEAGARRVVLIGRRVEKLKETEDKIKSASNGKCEVGLHSANVTSAAELKAVAKKEQDIGAWDVLVLCAGRANNPDTLENIDPDLWWNVMERLKTNTRGFFVTLHAFLPTRKQGARILNVSASIICFPAKMGPAVGASAYIASKFSQLPILDHAAAECPDLFVISVHPGIVETALMDESAMVAGAPGNRTSSIPLDDVELSAHFNVWATTSEASFLHGKFVSANWDVEQLKAQANTITDPRMLTANVIGWPFQMPS